MIVISALFYHFHDMQAMFRPVLGSMKEKEKPYQFTIAVIKST